MPRTDLLSRITLSYTRARAHMHIHTYVPHQRGEALKKLTSMFREIIIPLVCSCMCGTTVRPWPQSSCVGLALRRRTVPHPVVDTTYSDFRLFVVYTRVYVYQAERMNAIVLLNGLNDCILSYTFMKVFQVPGASKNRMFALCLY